MMLRLLLTILYGIHIGKCAGTFSSLNALFILFIYLYTGVLHAIENHNNHDHDILLNDHPVVPRHERHVSGAVAYQFR